MKPLTDYPTPRTDVEAAMPEYEGKFEASLVPTTFARTLEQQLSVCRDALDKAEIGLMHCIPTEGYDFSTLNEVREALDITK